MREAPFPDILQAGIRELWEVNGTHECVFCRKDGTLPSARYIRNRLPRWLERAGIRLDGRRIVPHSARHSLASVLEADGVPLRYIQDMLGHSYLKTTLGYLHTPQETINRIAKKTGAIAQQPEETTSGEKTANYKKAAVKSCCKVPELSLDCCNACTSSLLSRCKSADSSPALL
ncbi:MAG: site-specific integrase, partial [Treponema sp.]|nr:site-specific integrase [Treponema sp.]